MPRVYEGFEPYIFVSYAHADATAALPMIEALDGAGYRVWYDGGVEAGSEWPEYIARHVESCACFVSLFTQGAANSMNCRREINFALELGKPMLVVYLEDVELMLGMRMQLGMIQALYRAKHPTDESLRAELLRARVLAPCLDVVHAAREATDRERRERAERASAEEARRAEEVRKAAEEVKRAEEVRRAEEARKAAEREAQARREAEEARRIAAAKLARVRQAAQRARKEKERKASVGISAYSWAELKGVAERIAAAKGDGEGLAIARSYGLVDANGRLQGTTKEIVLSDNTKAHVRIVGFRHDNLASGGGLAGITFEFADVPARHRMNPEWTNEGGWKRSEMRLWLNRDFLGRLPGDLSQHIVAVRKRTNNRGKVSEGNTSCVTITNDRLWLLSMSEVYGRIADQKSKPWSPATYDAEGTQYQLYADQGVSTTNYGFAKKRGAYSWWWLRSPFAYDLWSFRLVYDDGVWSWLLAHDELGVSPGFCF